MPEVASTAVTRLLSIVAWLRTHPEATVTGLAAHFGRSRRQILRDLEYLTYVGDSLPGSSFELEWDEEDDWVSIRSAMGLQTPPSLSDDEVIALLIGLQAVAPTLPEEMRHSIPRLMMKLHGHVSGELSESAVLVSQAIQVQSRSTLSFLTVAIEEKRKIYLTYTDRFGKESHRCVKPVALSQKGTQWRLLAIDLSDGVERTFHVDHMGDVSFNPLVQSDTTGLGHLPSSADNLKTPQYVFALPQLPFDVTLRIAEAGRWVIEDLDLEATVNDDNSLTTTFTVHDHRWLTGLMADLGDRILEIAPECRTAVQTRARDALALWQSVDDDNAGEGKS